MLENAPVYAEDLVRSVRADFERRAAERRQLEAQWLLNANFVAGNQYCCAQPDGTVDTPAREYPWQEREVFNHIAPILETRLAKLNRVRPKMSVRPAGGDEDDMRTGKAAGKILDAACRTLELDTVIARATLWSELNGSSFYKVGWNGKAGRRVGRRSGKDIFEGDVYVEVCPSYEVYPDTLTCPDIEGATSLLHVRAVGCDEIERDWGIRVPSEGTDLLRLNTFAGTGGLGTYSVQPALGREHSDDRCLLIERYTRPTADKPEGELVITAGNTLLHCGPLPYRNGTDGTRDFPFVRQDALTRAGCFYGTSMIERAIPIQRAFNAIKNRKHEFLNRIASGVLAVEDGSVDVGNLEEEGLSPGKILVYRQGSNPPRMMDPGNVPNEFSYEEDRLLNEFVTVTGVSEIMRSSTVPSGLTSGVALQLLIEQDDTRLSVTAQNVRSAVRKVAQHILRLYKQFAAMPRLARCVGEAGEVELMSFSASDIGCDDVIFDTENELNSTPAAKQSMLFDLLKTGLLQDENGRLSDGMRYKILDAVGYGGWELTRDVSALQCQNAARENVSAAREQPEVSEIDDHTLHVNEHVKYMLSSEFKRLCRRKRGLYDRMMAHVRQHKILQKEEKNRGDVGADGVGEL